MRPILLDVATHGEDYLSYLNSREGSTPEAEKANKERIEQNSFVLTNTFGDLWWWGNNLITYIHSEVQEQLFNWFIGPIELKEIEQIMLSSLGENDIHLITYKQNGFKGKEALNSMKAYRKFQVKNTDKFFRLKFWTVEDPELAKKLCLHSEGDIYMLR